jgi:hypothetical protein
MFNQLQVQTHDGYTAVQAKNIIWRHGRMAALVPFQNAVPNIFFAVPFISSLNQGELPPSFETHRQTS